MLDLYVFIHKDRLEEIEDCGMKLSLWADRSISSNGEVKKYIASYLNPRDNMIKYKSPDYKVVKLEVEMKYCYVAEGFFMDFNSASLSGDSLYKESIVPAKDYIFGMYRKPECLIAKTILPEEMNIQRDGALSFPLFYESSQSLYLSKLMESLREENQSFDDAALYYYFDNLARKGKVKKEMDSSNQCAVFSLDNGCRPIVLAFSEQEVLIEG